MYVGYGVKMFYQNWIIYKVTGGIYYFNELLAFDGMYGLISKSNKLYVWILKIQPKYEINSNTYDFFVKLASISLVNCQIAIAIIMTSLFEHRYVMYFERARDFKIGYRDRKSTIFWIKRNTNVNKPYPISSF